jgi:dipeptidyl aminopeptidase/acylaminoacyl peptidase
MIFSCPRKSMMAKVLLAGLPVLFPALLAAKPVGIDDLMAVRTVVDVRISPDGERVAYAVSEASLDKNEHVAVLWLVPYEGGEPRRLTHSTRIFNRPLPRPELRWSPDGRLLSFLAFVSDFPQVMAMDARGGEPWALTSSPTGVGRYEWSGDSRRIAYLAAEPEPAEEAREKQEKTFVIRFGKPGRPNRLYVKDVDSAEVRAVSPLEHYVSGFDWSPDSGTLVYSASAAGEYLENWRSRLYTIPADGGDPSLLVGRDGMNFEPRFSPDGRFVAFISTGGVPRMISTPGLHLVSAAGGEPRALTGPDTWVREVLWESSQSLLFVPNEATGRDGDRMFEQPLFRVDLEGDTGILSPGAAVFSSSASADGSRIAFRSVGPRDAGDVVAKDLQSGASRTLTRVNPQLEELDIAPLEVLSWRSFDGMEIWGMLLTPPGYRAGTRLPLVVYVHGGPIGGFTQGLFPQFMHRPGQIEPYPVEAFAAKGFAVLMPMPRGGSGYGLEGFRKIVRSWGEGDFKDIMAGVDHLIERGLVDPDRLGVMGASYGGFMTNWIVTQTDRFKAASTAASISDIRDLYYLSDAGEVTEEYFGLPWKESALYEARSPITHVEAVKTPLLIQHGENDRRVPVQQAEKFYRALRKLGKTVEMDVYPRGGHVNYEPRMEKAIMERNLEWFERWLSRGETQ